MNRLAVPSDIPQLVDLRYLMQCEVHGLILGEMTSEFRMAATDYFRLALADGSYTSVVAENEGKLISGNGLITYRKPPSLDSTGGLVGYVSNVYTLPEYRGQGFASDLLKLLILHAKSIGVSKLHLGATDAGKGVYEKAGFTQVKFAALELRL